MGCVSSKLLKKNLQQELLYGNGELPNHVVSLTSSTYGVLKLEQDQKQLPIKKINEIVGQKREEDAPKVQALRSKRSPQKDDLEVINAWELMGDLEEEIPISNQQKKSPKLMGFRGGYLEKVEKSPFKSLNQVCSPKTVKKLGGKENKSGNDFAGDGKVGRLDCYTTPKGVLKSWNLSTNSSNKHQKATSFDSPRRSNSGALPSRRKSLSPLFDPDLIDSIDKELSQEAEQIKKMVSPQKPKSQSPRPRYPINSSMSILEKFEGKCPPRGENSVVIYTTTLRGIRKTFEDCNVVRSIIESYCIRMIERDISMDSGFKEELRKLMGTKEVKVPLVFVKGRLIGGADEVVKLEEEGTLEGLFGGIPKARAVCEGCGGIRFIMCMDCNGSCKVLDESQNKMVSKISSNPIFLLIICHIVNDNND
ncbi:hypothetical protein Cgig2_028653 [Carnegiea gigantea]|uniref:Glutaredoxin domain-containing protein n=1 Tax=Carnegiea gigantea TaxID=171969 RepID=A0A9Q1JM49_9CARY|nr:hypothetical protein Cgig2_028653 [Carnegiea gigantea]